MEREIDYICHECQQPVYKFRRNEVPYHICRKPDEQIQSTEPFSEKFSSIRVERKFVQFSLTAEEKKTLANPVIMDKIKEDLLHRMNQFTFEQFYQKPDIKVGIENVIHQLKDNN